jgi:hypothetical protein
MSVRIFSCHCHIEAAKCMVKDYLKLRNAQHPDVTHTYKNMKEKLHRTNATNWFNRICRRNHLTPDYIKNAADSPNQQCYYTTRAATTYRINQNHIILSVFYISMYSFKPYILKLTILHLYWFIKFL